VNVRRVIVLLSVVPLALLGAGSASAGISPAHGGWRVVADRYRAELD
jgi:hypothetical protein